MRNVLKALLAVASILLAYMCYKSVRTPIEFEEEKAIRDQAVIEKLVNIRKAQIAYKEAKAEYAGKMSDLIDFVNNGVIPKVAKKGELTDDQMKKGLTEEIAINLLPEDAEKYGITNYDSFMTNFRRDTIFVNVKQTIFGANFNANDMGKVPYAENTEFDMKADKVLTASNVTVPLFEASVPFKAYLKGLNEQQIINLIEERNTQEKFAGLKVGDVQSPNNNAGNWE